MGVSKDEPACGRARLRKRPHSCRGTAYLAKLEPAKNLLVLIMVWNCVRKIMSPRQRERNNVEAGGAIGSRRTAGRGLGERGGNLCHEYPPSDARFRAGR